VLTWVIRFIYWWRRLSIVWDASGSLFIVMGVRWRCFGVFVYCQLSRLSKLSEGTYCVYGPHAVRVKSFTDTVRVGNFIGSSTGGVTGGPDPKILDWGSAMCVNPRNLRWKLIFLHTIFKYVFQWKRFNFSDKVDTLVTVRPLIVWSILISVTLHRAISGAALTVAGINI
jgi:hypothetical protein